MKYLKIVPVVLLLILSCNNEKNSYGSDSMSKEMASINIDEMPLSEISYEDVENDKVAQKKMLIKTSYLSFETASIKKSYQQIKKQVTLLKGYIQSDNTNKQYNQISRSIIVRIPTVNFQQVIDSISNNVAVFDSKSISLKDVTEEFIDLESRLKSKKALENRYIQLLKKAKNVKEMLQIEKELAIIREEIEAKQGRLNYLKSQVSFSTINLTFYQPIKVVKSKSKTYFSKVLNAFQSGFRTFGDFILGILFIWPFVIIIGIAFYFIRKKILKRRKK